ncbi:endonuclease/exonuclease/phosphatase family protein [Inquilinus ginsengisoli]|uniref:endonuclease/exonuclease/phosphatase family protein n=1 Tax=Inquilinus ginsengisoli TaxID=363840 RepID=UPI00286A07BA|nr:endonuclease/exonuclease/phosphatase family protein [Inquilinus ginsengisoli]
MDPQPASSAPGAPPVTAVADTSARPVVVGSYNVHKCVGLDGRFDPARIAAVVAELGADVVALQEVDRRFGRRSGLLDAEMLRRDSGLHLLHVSDLPDGHGWHGNALLVRDGSVTRLRRLTLPGAEPRGAIITELALPAGPLRVVAAHFGLLRRCRMRQSAMILDAIAEGETMPTLLLGDLNEWRPGRRSSLRPLDALFGPMAASPPSFPAPLPLISLDRILGWPQGILRQVQVHRSTLARIASDHLPLKAWVDLDPARLSLQDRLPEAA